MIVKPIVKSIGTTLASAVIVSGLLAGCGQPGALTMPKKPAPPAAVPAPPALPTTN